MADDIDDLLDEVESQLSAKITVNSQKIESHSDILTRPSSKQTIKSRGKNSQNFAFSTNDSKRLKFKTEDISSLIDDICSIPDEQLTFETEVVNKRSPVLGTKIYHKCFPIFLEGSSNLRGMSSNLANRSCDNLRCLDCDFRVLYFDNFEWHSATDYFFLRNNMPDITKLSTNLVPKKGVRAYACQCKWQSIRDITEVQSVNDLKWICGKH